jgi:hypothetical protein
VETGNDRCRKRIDVRGEELLGARPHPPSWGGAFVCLLCSACRPRRLHESSQIPHKLLTPAQITPADTADEPGHAPIQFKPSAVARAARGLSDIKAAGTLPEDNRIIKMIIEHGGLHYVTAWVNAACRDELHPLFGELLAGAVRAGLLQKLDTVTGEFKGFRPLGIIEKWACLIWACVNLVMRKTLG